MSGVRTSGIDVSHYQGTVNWNKVKAAGHFFAFAKASESNGGRDSAFAKNLAGARSAGIRIGAYHFFRPSVSGTDQARNFLGAYTPSKGDLLPVCDLEDYDGSDIATYLKELNAWLDAVSAKSNGSKAMIYTSATFWKKLGNPKVLGDHPLWVAHYGVSSPVLPAPWANWTIWQYGASGAVAGVNGPCDQDWFAGTPDDLSSITM